MSFEEQKNKCILLEQWFSSDMGQAVLEAFLSELINIKDLLHGETLLQLGSGTQDAFFKTLPFTRKWTAAPYQGTQVDVVTLLNHLPFERDSIDCVLAPLTLETFYNKEDLIDEIDRVLRPMGHVVFFGINPLSLWGLWLFFSHNAYFPKVHLKPKSVLSIKFLMLHRGYIQNYLSGFYYVPPVNSKKRIYRYQVLNQVGKMMAPCPSGFYCLVVQKQENQFISEILLSSRKYISSTIPPLQPTCRKVNDIV